MIKTGEEIEKKLEELVDRLRERYVAINPLDIGKGGYGNNARIYYKDIYANIFVNADGYTLTLFEKAKQICWHRSMSETELYGWLDQCIERKKTEQLALF